MSRHIHLYKLAMKNEQKQKTMLAILKFPQKCFSRCDANYNSPTAHFWLEGNNNFLSSTCQSDVERTLYANIYVRRKMFKSFVTTQLCIRCCLLKKLQFQKMTVISNTRDKFKNGPKTINTCDLFGLLSTGYHIIYVFEWYSDVVKQIINQCVNISC